MDNCNKLKSQQGLTTLGWIVVIGIFAMITVTGFKILPLYLEYFQVRSIMQNVAANQAVDARSNREIWQSMSRQFLVNQIRDIQRKNVTFKRENDTTKITVDYEVRRPYIGQLFIGGRFTYTVEKK